MSSPSHDQPYEARIGELRATLPDAEAPAQSARDAGIQARPGKVGGAIERSLPFFRSMVATIQYIYYLRCALVLWIGLAAIALTDSTAHPNQLLHSIFTPGLKGQFLGAGFFITCNGWVALLLARIVGINGPSRFYSPQPAPRWLARWLGPESDSHAWAMVLIAQLPNLYVFAHLHTNAVADEVLLAQPPYLDLAWLAGGVLVAFLFWGLINTLYYWTFPFETFRRSAATLLYPRSLFHLGPRIAAPAPLPTDKTTTLESATALGKGFNIPLIDPLIDGFFRLLAKAGPGYSCQPPSHSPEGCNCTPRRDLWEAHRLATYGFLGYGLIYVLLFPITAPLPGKISTNVACFAGLSVLSALIILFVRSTRLELPPNIRRVRAGVLLILSVVLAGYLRAWLPSITRPPSLLFFPVIASVAILLTLIIYFLAGMAFFLDRFSFPLLFSAVLSFFLVHVAWRHIAPHIGSRAPDHYFHALPRTPALSPLLTPKEILQLRCRPDRLQCDVIVVTATGGGMHAAVWTSTILHTLEQQIYQGGGIVHPGGGQDNTQFHQSLVFASSVSGGSFGLASFLREYKAASPFDETPIPQPADPQHGAPAFAQRMDQAVSCSALEAVAWGLQYGDFLRFFFPFLHFSMDSDRSNALEHASARNYISPNCQKGNTSVPQENLPNPATTHTLTLASLPPSADPATSFPAFTFNTTEVETGGRVLLANYANPTEAHAGVYPASSFLNIYAKQNSQQDSKKDSGLDIDLLTAARLSATYPLVSSAARIDPAAFPGPAPHYVDGGYYDNDGIASLVEFLTSAFCANSPKPTCIPDTKDFSPTIRILLVEIRDGADLDIGRSPEDECSYDTHSQGVHCKPRGTGGQLDAPLETFWHTGHDSISRRNRRELSILRTAFSDFALGKSTPGSHVTFDEVVFPFTSYTALSWQLTPRELRCIRETAEQFLSPTDPTHKLNRSPVGQVLTWAQHPGTPLTGSIVPDPPSNCPR